MITAHEAREYMNNERNAESVRRLMQYVENEIKEASSSGYPKCFVFVNGSDECINELISMLSKQGFVCSDYGVMPGGCKKQILIEWADE